MVDAISDVYTEKRRTFVVFDATDGDITHTIATADAIEPFVVTEFFRKDDTANAVTITDGVAFSVSLDGTSDTASVFSDRTTYRYKVSSFSDAKAVQGAQLNSPKISGPVVQGPTAGTEYAVGDAGTVQRRVKKISGLTDDTMTDLFTITVPNGDHAAGFFMRVVGSLGDNDSTACDEYMVAIAREAGEATVAEGDVLVSSVAQPSATGAQEITMTFGITSMTGAVGATQTFTIQGKITKGGGASTSHTIMCAAELLNHNTGGVSFA